jgi:type IX secretion system substrate protein
MKATFTKTLLMACVAIFAINIANAQTVFWNEDFSAVSDLPTGWTTSDASGGSAMWAWCDDPSATNPCIINWAAYANQHDMGFFSTTGADGYVFMDSDNLGNVSPDHIANLTSGVIDCSGETEVWLKMESLLGVFGLDADMNAILQVSTDNANWTDFQIFEGLTTAERWSGNPEVSLIDITSVAAGSPTVYLQWSWTGNYEYYWLIDDIELYDEDPTALFVFAVDMRVNDNFFAIAPNAQTPASQVEQFGFLADIENVGYQELTGVNLNVTIVDDASSAVVYNEDLLYGTIGPDSLAENVLFASAGYTPEATANKTYTGTYTVSSDSVDLNPDNNTQTFDFIITDTTFAKDNGATRFISPAASNWDDGEPHSWAYGNYFHTPNGTGMYARYGSFAIGNADEVPGTILTLYLYEWTDANVDGEADPDERTPLGYNFYQVLGTETTDDLITLPLLEFSANEIAPIPLADGGNYIIMLEYQTVDITDFVMMATDAYDYSAQVFRSEELGNPRYGSMLGVNGDLTTEPYSSLGFGRDLSPVVRLSIGDEPITIIGVEDILSDDNKITVSPNPAESFINLNLDLVEAHDEAIIRIMDVAGKVITERVYSNVQNDTFNYNVSNYAAGTYFVHFISEEGSKTIQFVVTK